MSNIQNLIKDPKKKRYLTIIIVLLSLIGVIWFFLGRTGYYSTVTDPDTGIEITITGIEPGELKTGTWSFTWRATSVAQLNWIYAGIIHIETGQSKLVGTYGYGTSTTGGYTVTLNPSGVGMEILANHGEYDLYVRVTDKEGGDFNSTIKFYYESKPVETTTEEIITTTTEENGDTYITSPDLDVPFGFEFVLVSIVAIGLKKKIQVKDNEN